MIIIACEWYTCTWKDIVALEKKNIYLVLRFLSKPIIFKKNNLIIEINLMFSVYFPYFYIVATICS